MGKKYIIKIPDDKIGDFVGSTHFLMPYMMAGHIGHHDTGLPIAPYTEPDLEQVRKEAYEAGAKSSAVVIADDKAHEAYKLGYENGLNDAWEAARKICTNWVLSDSVLSEIFGMDKTIDDIMKENTASEVIEKIRQYEQEKDRQVRIEYNFDEIKDVLETTAKECNVSLDEIAEVLRKMKETDNG